MSYATGFWLFVVSCLLPLALYVTQPRTALALGLIGLYALCVVVWPAGRVRR